MKRKGRFTKSKKKIQPEPIVIKEENLLGSENFDEEIVPQNDEVPEVKVEQSSESENEDFENLSEDPNEEDSNGKNLEIREEEHSSEFEENYKLPDDSNEGDNNVTNYSIKEEYLSESEDFQNVSDDSNDGIEIKEEKDSRSDEFQDSSEISGDDDKESEGKMVKTGSYPCLLCGSVFPTRMILHKHQRKAHTVKRETGKLVVLRVKCSYPNCTQQFTGNSHRKIHEARIHSDLRPISCTEEGCDKTFKSKGSFITHFERTHANKRHTCNICYKEFKEIGKLRTHIATHLSKVDRKKFPCDLCNKSYLKKTSLKEHKMTVHKESLGGKVSLLKCTFSACSKTFPSISRRNNHVKVAHCPVKSFKCDVADCSKTFATKGHLNRHVERWHPPEDSKPVICPVEGCFKLFKNPERLRYHNKRIHEAECGECGEQFGFRKRLSLHMKTFRDGNPCTLCLKRLANMTRSHNMVTESEDGTTRIISAPGGRIFVPAAGKWVVPAPQPAIAPRPQVVAPKLLQGKYFPVIHRRTMKSKTPFVSTFKKLANNNHFCNICETELQTGGRWSKFLRHFKNMHKDYLKSLEGPESSQGQGNAAGVGPSSSVNLLRMKTPTILEKSSTKDNE